MTLYALPVRRPVATAMFFIAAMLLGLIAWQRIPVELLPPLEGEELFVNYFRPGSEPEVVEREILLPLEARTASHVEVTTPVISTANNATSAALSAVFRWTNFCRR